MTSPQFIINPFTGEFDATGNGGGGGGDLHVARYIVGDVTKGANYASIPLAYAAAIAAGGNQTVFVQPGNYNIGTMAIASNIGVTAFDCDGVIPNVIVNGKMTANFTGVCAFSGLYFINESDNILEITGSGSCQIRFIDSWIEVGGTAFGISNTNNSCAVTFETCQGDISGTSAYFDFTAGGVNINNSFFFNGQESSTPNNFTTSSIGIESSVFNSPISKTGLGGLSLLATSMICLNDTCITIGDAVNSDLVIYNCHIDSNNATAITIGTGNILTIANSSVGSSATDAISGTGTLRYSPIAFTKSSSSVNVSAEQPIRFGPSISPIMPDAFGTVYYDGTILTTTPAGIIGDVLTSNGPGVAPTMQSSATGPAANFSVYLSGNVANQTGDGTIAPVICDTVVTDTNSAYNTSTGIYTVPVTGFWQFNFSIFMFRVTGTNGVCIIDITINGSPLRTYEVNFENLQTSGELILNSSINWAANSGDTVQVACQITGSGSPNIGYGGTIAGTRFSGCLNR